MKIIDSLLSEMGIRVSNSNGRWLVRDNFSPERVAGEFVVYERKYGKRSTTEVYRGTDEDEAVKFLLGEDE